MRVLVTSAKSRIAYNILKSLSNRGLQVFLGDSAPLSMSFYSKYSAGHFFYPSPFIDQENFIKCLINKIFDLKINVLLPVCEELFLVSKYRKELSKHVNMAIPEYSQILTAHNKDKWVPIAEQLGIPVPQMYTVSQLMNNPRIFDSLKFPVFIKPKQGGGGWGINLYSSSEALKKALAENRHQALGWDRFFVQEKVRGPTHCVAMLFSHGDLRAKVGYEQLREYPIGAGQATLRISKRNEKAEAYLTKFLEHLGWHGICQADFVVDKQTGIPYLIDINPRFWGSLFQAIASNVDFPYLTYQIAIYGDVEPVTDFTAGVKTRWVGGDLRTFFPLLKKARNRIHFVSDFLDPSKNLISCDDFSLDDPLPFLCWALDSILRVVKNRSFSPAPSDSLEGIWE